MEEIERLYQKYKHVTSCRSLPKDQFEEVALLFKLASQEFKLRGNLSTCNPTYGLKLIGTNLQRRA